MEMPESLSPVVVASIIFACTFAAALFGMVLHRKLPDHHLNDESKEVEKLVMGLIATLAALVLGLLVASAKSSFDRQSAELRQVSATVLELDGLLAHFGPGASEARQRFHSAVSVATAKIWSNDNVRLGLANHVEANAFYDSIQNLSPNTEAQRFIQKRALEISAALRQTSALMIERVGSSIPWPFLTILVFWLSVLFLGFGLFASVNATVLVALLIGALSVSSGIFLILELDQPYQGLIRVSDAPLRNALAQINQ
ncbi:hypothetical protein CU048_10830 [Beijerinckiaceae bacterium]|nr:hypothetical protein CU048_10830 [Beijerinckiaceae bacterium]